MKMDLREMQEAIDKLNYWDDESWVLKRAQEGDIVTQRMCGLCARLLTPSTRVHVSSLKRWGNSYMIEFGRRNEILCNKTQLKGRQRKWIDYMHNRCKHRSMYSAA